MTDANQFHCRAGMLSARLRADIFPPPVDDARPGRGGKIPRKRHRGNIPALQFSPPVRRRSPDRVVLHPSSSIPHLPSPEAPWTS
jgi:hypothetical protein